MSFDKSLWFLFFICHLDWYDRLASFPSSMFHLRLNASESALRKVVTLLAHELYLGRLHHRLRIDLLLIAGVFKLCVNLFEHVSLPLRHHIFGDAVLLL